MKRVGAVIVVALCALPAHGDQKHFVLNQVQEHVLTPIDSLPTRESIETVFSTADPVVELAQIATAPTDGSMVPDFGVRLRAIRSLPQFCPTPCDDTLAHDTLVAIIQSIPATDQTGQSILRLRAAIESLGVAKSGDPNDVSLLVPLLDHQSRDIRAATARALRDLCDPDAILPLRARLQIETIGQVSLAISAALRDLGQCSP